MLHKCFVWIGLVLAVLATSAFTNQSSPAQNAPIGWSALAIVLVVIIVVAILMILQSRLTPSAAARYHLDHAVLEQTELVQSEAAAGAPNSTRLDDPIQIEGIGP